MSDALSDGARAAAQADAYLDYLEALKDYLELRTGGSFSRFMSLASEVSEHLRGWGGSRLDLTDKEGREYVGKLVSEDLETWATLIRTSHFENVWRTDALQHISPFTGKVLLFYVSRDGHFSIEESFNTRELLLAAGVKTRQDNGKYMIAVDATKVGVVLVRADKKIPSKK